MDFEYIVLTKKEYRWLRKLSKNPKGLPTNQHERNLMENKLIDRCRYGSQNEENAMSITTLSKINEQGHNYLLYRKNKRRQWWWSNGLQLINILLALIAAVTGIIALIK